MAATQDNPPVCLLAGGLGQRLRPLTEMVPKPMLEVEGKPFIQLVMEHFASLGYRRFVLAVSYLWERFQEHFSDGSSFGWQIEYSVEPMPLGTGGAILLAQRHWGDCSLVANGDTFMDEDWRELIRTHRQAKLPVTLAAAWQEDTARFGRLEIRDGRVERFVEKDAAGGPGWVNAGVYFLRRSALEGWEVGSSFSLEKDVFPRLAGRIAVHHCRRKFADIGTVDSLEAFRGSAAGLKPAAGRGTSCSPCDPSRPEEGRKS